jgi:hypothetical protein
MPGFQNAYITKMGLEMRLRDGRRIMGDYVLGWDDVAEGRRHYDCIGKSTFSAGAVHVADNRTIAASNRGTVKPPNKGTYDLPYRMLVPRKIENLLIAGKHVSAERVAYQRFLQETMVSGQAARGRRALRQEGRHPAPARGRELYQGTAGYPAQPARHPRRRPLTITLIITRAPVRVLLLHYAYKVLFTTCCAFYTFLTLPCYIIHI